MRTKFIVTVLLGIIFCTSLFVSPQAFAAASQPPPFQEADIMPGELIVIMKTGSTLSGLSLPEQARGSTQKHPGLEKLNAGVINVPQGKEREYILKLQKQEDVLVVEPNYRVSAFLIPDDTSYASQYALPLIQAPLAWDTTTGSTSITMAIIDSGVDATHPEFAGRLVAGYDFVNDDSTPEDQCGHGTHVTGIAAATGSNTQGIAGVAWGVKIMPLRALDAVCGGSYSDVAGALIWAADHGAKIINLSLGGQFPSTTLQNAVNYAYSRDAAIFAAAGNSSMGLVFYPAAYPQVMAVSSVDATQTRAINANFGSALDIMAPGVGIYSTMPMTSGFRYNVVLGKSTQYDYLDGTSMASPHAAGAAALLASLSCFDTPDKIYRALMDTALDLGAGGWDQFYGYGLIQIADAMALCSTTPPTTFAVEYDMVSSESCSPLVQFDWIDATNGPSASYAIGNEGYRSVALPLPAFSFNYGGTDYTSVTIHDNGYISLGSNQNTNSPSSPEGNYKNNLQLPAELKPDNFIAPFWDDLKGNSGGGIYIKTIGAAPARQFVIEYNGAQRVGVTGSLNFEVILFEGSNNIKMQYRTLTGSGSDGDSATVGLEYGSIFSGFAGYEYSYNRPGALKDGLAVLFIPYTSGDPTLPSHAVCPQMKAVTIEAGVANACNAAPAAFDVSIATGQLIYRSILKVQQMSTAPTLPASFVDMQHYADINLTYSPPAPSLSPMPEVYVCYQYTPQDVLAAGGHPENLFFAAHDEYTNQWQPLPTTVDALNMQLTALAQHFSYYSVTTLKPASANKLDGLNLPVTGSPLSREFLVFLIALGVVMIFPLSGKWLKRKRR